VKPPLPADPRIDPSGCRLSIESIPNYPGVYEFFLKIAPSCQSGIRISLKIAAHPIPGRWLVSTYFAQSVVDAGFALDINRFTKYQNHKPVIKTGLST
jgi:hypothetical protein